MGKRAPLPVGELELAILDVLWNHGPLGVAEVRKRLSPKKRLAYTTILTVMARLEQKGCLRRTRLGRGHTYRAAIERSDARRATLSNLIRRLFGGSPSELVANLVENEILDDAELARIEAMIRAARAAPGGDGKRKRG